MELNEIQKKIELAKNATSMISEPLKTEAFKIILSELISNNNSNSTMPNIKRNKNKSKKHNNHNLDNNMIFEIKHELSELAKKCDVTNNELSEIMVIKNNVIEIIKPIIGSEAIQHRTVAQIVLATYFILYDIEWLPSRELRKCLDISGLTGFTHLGTNLSSITSSITSKGLKKGTEYKITGKGLRVAYELIKKLSKNKVTSEK